MDRDEKLRSMYGTVSRMKQAGYNTGQPQLRKSHEVINEEDEEKKKKRRTFIPSNLNPEDARWLHNFLKE